MFKKKKFRKKEKNIYLKIIKGLYLQKCRLSKVYKYIIWI